MSRLSQTIRERMATALVKHSFADRAAGLIAESQRLFHLVYEAHYDAETRKHITAIRKRVRNGFPMKNELSLNVNGRQFDVGAESFGPSEVRWSPECERVAVLEDLDHYNGRASFAADHPLAERLLAFADQRKACSDEAGVAYKEALGALQQFTTGKKLAEDWPEALPVIGDLIPEDNRTLPVVQVAHLNSKFGLPPKTEKRV